ncbi:hypothetical protein GCM10007301_12690 [Azorhizobium oxalatiphilum]|uniref:Uncharacterized protein n=1 Tax=Azorhizobium oxalatiphilum TaxID=980631 RepID=A0A917BU81_9HYPH|nr:hypothetical protein GCM10007301_12690 [Azorhizobium oxalatiphilum]
MPDLVGGEDVGNNDEHGIRVFQTDAAAQARGGKRCGPLESHGAVRDTSGARSRAAPCEAARAGNQNVVPMFNMNVRPEDGTARTALKLEV